MGVFKNFNKRVRHRERERERNEDKRGERAVV